MSICMQCGSSYGCKHQSAAVATAPKPSPTPTVEVSRDRYGRPLIIPPGGDKPVGYARWSSYGDVLEDRYNLEKWKVRTAATGLADRPDLLLAVAAARGNKRQLDDICEQALEAAKGSAAATTGTALHSLSELVDRDEPLPVLPPSAEADLAAYRKATACLNVVAIEQFVVCDDPQAAGTFDRIVEHEGRRYVADIKTGDVKWGIGKIAVQLAGYSRSQVYDPATGERTPLDVDQSRALVIHLPQGQASCELIWVDIEEGWQGVLMAQQVRSWRKTSKGLTAPFGQVAS